MKILRKTKLEKEENDLKEGEDSNQSSAMSKGKLDYRVYHMKFIERFVYFILSFLSGAAVGYLFYGGIGVDEFGQSTMLTHILNVFFSTGFGIAAGIIFLPIRHKQLAKKRKRMLREQFRSLLEGLATSLGAGNNVPDSFRSIRKDLSVQYEEEAFIIKEVDAVLAGITNNQRIEDLLFNFGERSGIDDIINFSNVFKVSYRKGGNIKEVIGNTHSIISEKMEIEEEIETIITSNKMEQNVMIFMPIMLIGAIKLMSPEFGSYFASATGVISTTVAMGCFIGAYFLGRVLTDIKV